MSTKRYIGAPVSTEEDGVDEAGRTTQSPLIMAPPSLKADPDGEAAGTVVDNGTMASRNRTGTSRSGVSNGDSSASDDAATTEPAASADEDTTEAGLRTAAPAAPAAAATSTPTATVRSAA